MSDALQTHLIVILKTPWNSLNGGVITHHNHFYLVHKITGYIVRYIFFELLLPEVELIANANANALLLPSNNLNPQNPYKYSSTANNFRCSRIAKRSVMPAM